MKKKPQTPLTEGEILRQKAEEQLKRKSSKTDLKRSEADAQKLIHELQVHQIELEIQNEELLQAKIDEGVATHKYIELYDFAPSGYFTLSKEGKIIMLNLKGASMLGKERQRLINNAFGLFVSLGTRPIFNNFLSKAFKGKKDESCELTISIDDNKQLLDVILTGHVSENSEECQITMVDITERKQAEEALRRNETLQRKMVANIGDVIVIIDQNGINRYKSLNITQLFGWEPDEMLGKSTWDVVHPDDLEYAQKFVNSLSTEPNATGSTEIRYRRKDGKYVWIEITMVNLLFDPDIQGFLGNYHDITERKQAEEARRQSFVFNETLLKTIPFGMDIVDETGTILFQSEQFKNIFGEGTIGKKCWDLYKDNKKQCGDCPLFKGITIGETKTYESHGILGNRIFDISHTGMMFKGKKAMLEIFQDITEQKEKEKELIFAKEKAEESDSLKSAFLANMSHEIRTPMNGILGFSDLLKNPTLTGEEQQKYIQIIEKSGARMLNIINNIVSISKIESGQMDVNISDSNINEQIEYIYTFFYPAIKAMGMQFLIKNSLPLSRAIIKTDKEKLFGILTNLVKNAIKYSDKGSIEIGCDKKGKHLEFYVKDSGIGIDSNRQEAIFERFVQADIKDMMARQGAGLGLSISRVYVEMLGGKLWVESETGIGSTFYFTIPYTTELKETVEITIENANGVMDNQIKNLKILIVEDDETSSELLSLMLTEMSSEILNTSNGIEAIELCRSNPDIDLILMDIQMPVMGGYEATQQIRQFNKDVIIIAQTAYGLTGDKEKAIEAGCNAYISKPIKKDELLSLIQQYFIK